MTVRISVELTLPRGRNPFAQGFSKRRALNEFAAKLHALAGGVGGGTGADRTTLRVATATASGTVTCAAVQNADTVTINGQALTATQHHARGTITPTVSGIDVDDTLLVHETTLTAKKHHSTGTVTIVIANTDVDDTVTINGYAFTAKNAENLGAGQFDISGTATAAATSLAACINASTDPLIAGLVTATSDVGVVTVRKVSTGTGTYTLVSSDADGLAVSGAGTLTAGTAPAAGQFDISGSNAQCCTSILAAINASAALTAVLTASTTSTVVTIRSRISGAAGNYVLTSSDAQLAVSGSGTMTGGANVANNQFDFGGTDTETATALAAAINATTTDIVELQVEAESEAAVVTITAEEAGVSGNAITLASSDAGRLACSVTRLAGGTETTYTF